MVPLRFPLLLLYRRFLPSLALPPSLSLSLHPFRLFLRLLLLALTDNPGLPQDVLIK